MPAASVLRIPDAVTVFRELRLPEAAQPVGHAAVMAALERDVPPPATLSAIGPRHKIYRRYGWRVFTPRYRPAATLEGHLTFALKHEGLDLIVLESAFLTMAPAPVEAMVRRMPTGAYARRL